VVPIRAAQVAAVTAHLHPELLQVVEVLFPTVIQVVTLPHPEVVVQEVAAPSPPEVVEALVAAEVAVQDADTKRV